jgi:hypothetical protein
MLYGKDYRREKQLNSRARLPTETGIETVPADLDAGFVWALLLVGCHGIWVPIYIGTSVYDAEGGVPICLHYNFVQLTLQCRRIGTYTRPPHLNLPPPVAVMPPNM